MNRRREYGLSALTAATNTQLKQQRFVAISVGVIKLDGGMIHNGGICDVEVVRSRRGLAAKDGVGRRQNCPRQRQRFRAIQIDINQPVRGRSHLDTDILRCAVEVFIDVAVVDLDVLPLRAGRRLLAAERNRYRVPAAVDVAARGLPNRGNGLAFFGINVVLHTHSLSRAWRLLG
jgi:hypothetical protein